MIQHPANELHSLPLETKVALLRSSGDTWSALVGTTGPNPQIIATAESIPSEDVDKWVNDHEAKHGIIIIPSSMTATRSFHLPTSEEDELELALRLQAEAHFLGSSPPHRIGYALLGKKASEENRIGISLAWPPSSTLNPPNLSIPTRYAPETAGILSLASPSYDQKIILSLSQKEESITILMRANSGIQIRSTREIPTKGSFATSVKNLIKESGLQINLNEEKIEKLQAQVNKFSKIIDSGKPLLLGLPFDYLQKIAEGTSRDAAWWGLFGTSVGLLRCAGTPMDSCLNLSAEEPQVRLKLWEKIGLRLAQKQTMLRAAIAAALLIALLPPAFQYLRLKLLESEFPDIEKQVSIVETNQRRIAMYKSLGNMSWPMNKLLADLAANTPRGINIEQVSITEGQPITILGVALKEDSGNNNSTPAELIALMQKQLAEDKIFGDVNFKYQEADDFSGTRDFQMSIPVLSPMLMISYGKEKDYGTRTLAMRKAGVEPEDLTPEGLIRRNGSNNTSAKNPTPPPETEQEPIAPKDPEPVTPSEDDNTETENSLDNQERDRRSSGNTRRVGDGSSNMGSRFDGGSGAAPGSIPPPISDGQLALMSQSEVMDALKKVSAAKQVATDETDQDRLDSDLQRLMGRLRELRKKK